ncbi:hypothetical protein EN866_33545 [Mesorhizobium sp. M2D.F.Ca.ET.223.01.1.1]|uniref:hypothetical protein n=1 Tax=Mesorhizobium sp. M2D.F.Ca.ET.223.01.1.1 TaxID=2563940 RepID=UPI001092C383|nr:hypothetical protein [Mesorhizobium sp. M2D.F.Ca.ET.223.01.1.1]TGR84243.1 hypothetical protein EN866_33545 [Mesorhizobium sp. M2D.F.Ca.ET.223.01.1.1]TGT76000.1 hypothetical protein EN802_07205 [bacterium M00.F.Ca.ET.159.01.1.1]TGT85061.1 hypothetical protein EN800_13935 [bacterium M00.F.Ca.ET.157.01.1.1]
MSFLSLRSLGSRLRGAPPDEKNEVLAHEWLSLETIWKAARATLPDTAQKEIEDLFPKPLVWKSGAEEWHMLNAAEQAVGSVLSEPQLTTEFMVLMELARIRKLANLAAHENNVKLFDPTDESDAAIKRKRAAYIALLDDLQRWFINRRFSRKLRSETASRLFYFGLCVMGISVLPFLLYFLMFSLKFDGTSMVPGDVAKGHKLFSSNPLFGLGMVSAFGILGVYFSRVMRFQMNIQTFGFEDVMTEYQPRMLYVRLLYGMIGAFVFYFLLRSGIIGGSAFPDLANISVGEQIVWQASATDISPSPLHTKVMDPSGLSILGPTVDLAKLLVWSFLAGFSERLVPDTLDRTEARAKNSDHE